MKTPTVTPFTKLQSRKLRRILATSAAALIALHLAPPSAHALVHTWNGSTSTSWSNGANWTTAEPTAVDTATFSLGGGGVFGSIITLSAGEVANSLNFTVNGYVLNAGDLTLTAGGGGLVSVAGGVTGTINTPLIGAASTLDKIGTGTLVLGGVNLYGGATTVTGGTLTVGAGGSIAAGSAVTVLSGATLNGSGTILGTTATGVTGGATIAGTGLTLTGVTTFNGVGNALNGANTATGGVVVSAGATVLQTGTLTGNLNAINAGATFTANGAVTGTAAVNAAGTLAGTGSIGGATTVTSGHIVGNGLILTGLTTFNGIGNTLSGTETAIAGVTLGAGATVIQTGTLTGNLNTTNTGTFTANGVVAGNATVATGGTLAGSGNINGTTTVANGAIAGNGLTLTGATTFNGGGGAALSGTVISVNGVTATGAATVVTQSGQLTGNVNAINNGTFNANGTVTGNAVVNTGGFLGGSGIITGTTTVNGANIASSGLTLTGVTTFTGTNSLTGTQTSIAGVVLAAGAGVTQSGVLTGNVNALNAGATFNTNGIVTGTMNVLAGGTLTGVVGGNILGATTVTQGTINSNGLTLTGLTTFNGAGNLLAGAQTSVAGVVLAAGAGVSQTGTLTGNVNAINNTAILTANGTVTGSATVLAGGTLQGNATGNIQGVTNVTSGTINGTAPGFTLGGLVTFNGAGNILSGTETATNGVTLAAGAGVTQTGTLTGNINAINSGALLTANGTVTGTALVLAGGTLGGSGAVTGLTTVNGGTINGNGLTLTGGAVFNGLGNTLSGTETGNVTLNAGAAVIQTGTLTGNITAINAGALFTANGVVTGTATINPAGTLAGTGNIVGATTVTSGNINGNGLILTGLTTFNGLGNTLSGTETALAGVTLGAGATVIQTGTLTGNLNGTNTGIFTANGTVLGNATVDIGGTLAGSGRINGTTGVTSGTIAGNGLTLTGLTTFSGAGNILSGTETATAGVVLAAGATVTQTGTLTGNLNGTNTGIFTANGVVTGNATVNPGGTLAGSGNINGVTNVNAGTIAGNGLTLTGLTTFIGLGNTLSGTETALAGVTLAAGATVTQTGTLTGNLNGTNTGTFTANGIVTGNTTVNAAGTLAGSGNILGTTTVTSGTVNGTGLTLTGLTTFNGAGNVLSGTETSVAGVVLAAGAGVTQTGTLTGNVNAINAGATLTANGTVTGSATVLAGGTLAGSGTITGPTNVTSGTINGTGLTLTGLTTFNGVGNVLSGTETATNGVTLAAGAGVTQTGGTLTGNINAINSGALFTANGTVTGTALVLAGGTLGGSGTINGLTTVTGGTINGAGLNLVGNAVFNGAGNVLSGTETGNVSLNAGAAVVQTGTLTGNVTAINAGAVLTANGVVTGAANVLSGGTLNGGGTLGSATLAGTGVINFGPTANILGTLGITGGSWLGQGTVTGPATASGAANTFTIGAGANMTALGGLAVTGGSLAGPGTLTGSLNYTSAQNSIFNGVIAGIASTVTMNNPVSVLVLTGANTYGGLTTVNTGILEVGNNAALGSTLAGTTVNVGGSLRLENGIVITGEALTLNGAGSSASVGALSLVNGATTASYLGPITIATNSTITANGGTLNLGSIVKNGTNLTIGTATSGGGTVNINGVISGAAANSDLIVESTTVNLNAANTYNGPTTIRSSGGFGLGILNANVAGALPDPAFAAPARSALTMDDVGLGGSMLNLNGAVGQVVASLASPNATSKVVINGNTLTIGTAAGSTSFAGVISGAGNAVTGAIVKDGASTQILAGANTYTGATTVTAGRLQAGVATVAGVSGAFGVNSATTVGTGATAATLAVQGFNTTIGTLSGNTNGNVQNGAVGAAALTVGSGVVAGTSTFAGTLTDGGAGALSLVKIGTGTQILSGVGSSFTGPTTVTAGTLQVDGTFTSAANTVTTQTGATLAGSGTITGAVNVNAGATLDPGAFGNLAGTLNTGALTLGGNTTQVNYDLGQAGVPGGLLNDLTNVTGPLVLDGTLNVTQTNLGNFTAGGYRLFNYTGGLGNLTNNTLAIGTLPIPVVAAVVNTAVANQVNLLVLTAAGIAGTQYWDPAPINNGVVNGGNGTWTNFGTNWTEVTATNNSAWTSGNAVFGGGSGAPQALTGGTVTVSDTIYVAGMTFNPTANGTTYTIAPDAAPVTPGFQLFLLGATTINTNTAAGVTSTITAPMTDSLIAGFTPGSVVKNGNGILAIGNATAGSTQNSYTGGTVLNAGGLDIRSNSALGTGLFTINGGSVGANAPVLAAPAPLIANSVAVNAGFGVFGNLVNTFPTKTSNGVTFNGIATQGGNTGFALNSANTVINTTGGFVDFTGVITENVAGAGLTFTGSTATLIGGKSGATAGAAISNSYTGLTDVQGGFVQLGKTSGAVAISGNLKIDGGAVVQFLTGAPTTDNQIITTANALVNGVLNTSGHNQTLDDVSGNGNVELSGGGVAGTLTVNSGVFTGVISDGLLGGRLIKNSPGTLILTGANTYRGNTFINGGTLVLDGSVRSANILVGGAGTLTGIGRTFGNVTNAGNFKPGRSPGTFTIDGNFTQTFGGTLTIEIAGKTPPNHDLVAIGGQANLDGNLRLVNLNGTKLKVGERITFITAGGGVNGEFSNVENPFSPTGTIVRNEVLYLSNSVVLEAVQGSFKEFADNQGLTPNQKSVAAALDKIAFNPKEAKLIGFLDAKLLRELPHDFDLIAAEELQAIYTIGIAQANAQTANISRRTDQIRAGAAGFSDSGLSVSGLTPQYSGNYLMPNGGLAGPEGKYSKELRPPAEDNRVGVFVTGSGEFASIGKTYNASGYDLTSAGFTIGVDYRVTENFAVGINAGYARSSVDLFDDGNLEVDGAKLGLYATYFNSGFYVDASVQGGYNTYDTRRSALQGTARGNTKGAEINALIATGYDVKSGGLTVGPTASFQYTNVGFEDFREHGSLAPLKYGSQSGESMRTALGLKAAYEFQIGSIIVKPEIRAAWQHEFGDTAFGISSRFQNGSSDFTVHGAETGEDSLLLGAGFAILWNERTSTYVYYDGELGRSNYDSANVSGGVRMAF